MTRDHPRVCGEKIPSPIGCKSTTGSPPRMRGKEVADVVDGKGQGITPAYAGKRPDGYVVLAPSGDHPRVCGEKPMVHPVLSGSVGSPPRMRGKADSTIFSSSCKGITPAYAGKRPRSSTAGNCPWDHPRVCGEKVKALQGLVGHLGSPPRMRGKVVHIDRYKLAFGITPAYAGKSLRLLGFLRSLWDHPRVCGEKEKGKKRFLGSEGSPPRMRGKGLRHHVRHL